VVLHIGYAWLAFGLLLLGADGLYPLLPQTAAWQGRSESTAPPIGRAARLC
jgi:hypothetical protein